MHDSIEVDGRPRTFTVVGPTGVTPSRDLVLVLHGSKQNGTKHREFTGRAFDALAETHGPSSRTSTATGATGTTPAGPAGFRPGGRTSTTSASSGR